MSDETKFQVFNQAGNIEQAHGEDDLLEKLQGKTEALLRREIATAKTSQERSVLFAAANSQMELDRRADEAQRKLLISTTRTVAWATVLAALGGTLFGFILGKFWGA